MFGEKFHITLGGRYSHDEKVGALTIVNGRPPNVNGVVGPQFFVSSEAITSRGSRTMLIKSALGNSFLMRRAWAILSGVVSTQYF